MAERPNVKSEARRLVESLPDTASWDDVAYEVYIRQSIEVGLADPRMAVSYHLPHPKRRYPLYRPYEPA